MKRGGVRTTKQYVTEEDGKKIIKYAIQGRKGKLWIPVVENKIPMVYDTLKEAEEKLLEIVRQIRK